MESRTSKNIRTITYLAMLTAIVIVLQYAGNFIRFGTFSVSLVLMPIVLGAAICGPVGGAWLGAVFGFIVIATGGAAQFLAIDPIGTVITVMVKGTLAGLLSGVVYNLVANAKRKNNESSDENAQKRKKHHYGAVTLAAITCPVVNTGIFLLGCLVFFMDTINGWAAEAGVSSATLLIFGLVGFNFVFELLVNMVLVPAIVGLIDLVPNLRGRKKR